jgi:FdhE protein
LSALTLEAWLGGHSYLQPLADFAAEVDAAAAQMEIPRAGLPDWDAYADSFRTGLPLLHSPDAAIDLDPAGKLAAALVEKLSSTSRTGRFLEGLCQLDSMLRRERDAPRRIVDWLLNGEGFDEGLAPSSAGLLRYLGWKAMARYLSPVVVAFAGWRDEELWMRSYCPTCGSLPAMAQLIGADTGRIRLFSCGSCGTRWQYTRTACPFCENDAQRLSALAIEGEAGLRIDYCESCRGYLKTYNGQGEEVVLLSDWTSLHLDFLARDRGLKRLAASLYDLGFVPAREPRPTATSISAG